MQRPQQSRFSRNPHHLVSSADSTAVLRVWTRLHPLLGSERWLTKTQAPSPDAAKDSVEHLSQVLDFVRVLSAVVLLQVGVPRALQKRGGVARDECQRLTP